MEEKDENPFFVAAAAFVAAALILILFPTPAGAQQATCNDRDYFIDRLAKKYGEAPVALGVTNKGGLVEVLSTSDGETWTIIISLPNGTSCRVAAGEGWRTATPTPQGLEA